MANIKRLLLRMRWLNNYNSPLALLAIIASMLYASHGYAVDKASNRIITPPALDYASLCKQEIALSSQQQKALLARASSALSAKEYHQLGELYEKGNNDIIPNALKALHYYEKAAATSRYIYPAALIDAARLYLGEEGISRDAEKAQSLLLKAAAKETSHSNLLLAQLSEEKGDYAQAKLYYKKSAAAGNPKAALKLAWLAKRGLVTLDNGQTVDNLLDYAQNKLLEELNQGDCSALHHFGRIYLSNEIVKRQEKVAVEWLQISAKYGHLDSALLLARLYARGDGVKADPTKALSLWTQAADAGSIEAAYQLGRAYMLGYATDKQPDRAMIWLTKAAHAGHYQAMSMLIDTYDGVYDRTLANQKDLLQWLRQAASQPKADADIFYRTAMLLLAGEQVQRNLAESTQLFEKAARLGHKEAAHRLAIAYRFGWGVEQQPVKALRYTRFASMLGRDKSTYDMASFYHCGVGTPPNQAKTVKWLNRAASEGNMEAMLSYADMTSADTSKRQRQALKTDYLQKAVDKDKSKAMTLLALEKQSKGKFKDAAELFKRALEQGDNPSESYLVLGRAYLKGDKVIKNIDKGVAYLLQATKDGNLNALHSLMQHKFRENNLTKEDMDWLKQYAPKDEEIALLLGDVYLSKAYFDLTKAEQYLTLSALGGSVNAIIKLTLYDMNPITPSGWWERAEKAGICERKSLLLAASYAESQQQPEIAKHYLKKAAMLGSRDAGKKLRQFK